MTTPKKRGRKRDPKSKRSLGLPRHVHPRKVFHGPQELFDRLKRYAAKYYGFNEAEALRDLVCQALFDKGFPRKS